MHNAKILKDSISKVGYRLTTFELTYPRIIHGEVMTHRLFSRSAASSRAIPVRKMIKMIEDNPYIPTHWGKNQKGMQAEVELTDGQKEAARSEWLRARDGALESASKMREIGLHKQIANRVLEPFQWYTIILTATEYSNFFNLRNHPDAHPEIKKLAEMMQSAYTSNTPQELKIGEWHTPLIGVVKGEEEEIAEELGSEGFKKVSTGRCARVSYLTHDGERDFHKDVELHDRLLASGHMSPAEHLATPYDRLDPEHQEIAFTAPDGTKWFGNFRGWVQYRKLIPGEFDIKHYRQKGHNLS